MSVYNEDFYADRDASTQYAAREILSRALTFLPPIESAVDIGCGVGTWLKATNLNDVLGIDGPWVNADKLVIPRSRFREHDFSKGFAVNVGRRFDLAMTLEVAEHIDPKNADTFVQLLTDLSDLVLFSAAIPGQGGIGHVNEQWPAYWAERFAKRGYVLNDGIRPQIWNDSKIPYWYRQNVFLFGKPEKLQENGSALPLVHPELFQVRTQLYAGDAARLLIRAISQGVKRKLLRA